MVVLWVLIVTSGVFAVAAGVQAVRLLGDVAGDMDRVTRRLAVSDAALQQTERRLEAQQILLAEAGAWMRARQGGP